ncbi:hypothetical protein B7486_70910, partial [cyanobacterium TDX16]
MPPVQVRSVRRRSRGPSPHSSRSWTPRRGPRPVGAPRPSPSGRALRSPQARPSKRCTGRCSTEVRGW